MNAHQTNFLYCDNKTKEIINKIKTQREWLFKNLLESINDNKVLCLLQFNDDDNLFLSNNILKVFTNNNTDCDLITIDSCSEYHFDKKLWFTISLNNNELMFDILLSNYDNYKFEFNFNPNEPIHLEDIY